MEIGPQTDIQTHTHTHTHTHRRGSFYRYIRSIELLYQLGLEMCSVFNIGLQCTGLLSTDVDIRIQMNVSRASNVIILDIRRKKACIRGTRCNLTTHVMVINGYYSLITVSVMKRLRFIMQHFSQLFPTILA